MKIVVFCLAVSINILKFFELEQVEEKVSTKNLPGVHCSWWGGQNNLRKNLKLALINYSMKALYMRESITDTSG